MACIKYIERRFTEDQMRTIAQANAIIDEYAGQGYSLTLRQLYYQFVSKALIPNNDKEYNRLGKLISDARLAGFVDWDAIEDRGRYLRGTSFVESPAESIAQARRTYALDLWHNQPYRPEVWVEKEALVDVIGSICGTLRVNFFACKGYNSQSAQHEAGQRFFNYIRKGQQPLVFHLGDHDPSGIDMTRDNRDRLAMFAGTPVNVVRLALNRSQVDKYQPPPNPAKITDTRAAAYIEEHGESSWELDALSPAVIAELISSAVGKVRDERLWSEALAEEAEDKDRLDRIIEGL